MPNAPALLDPRGEPVPAEMIQYIRSRAQGGGMKALQSGGADMAFPYEASALTSVEMSEWLPVVRSPDSEINPYRDRMVGRVRDLVRNDSWAAGAIESLLDSTIGAKLVMVSEPDWQWLAWKYGKGFDHVWADEFGERWEAIWRDYSENLGHYGDVSQQLTVGQQLRLAWRHKLVDGEPLMLRYWLPEYVGRGAADYATAHLVVDPDRLSNPYQMLDTKHLRGGVEINDNGVPLAYHIREAHQYDWYNALEANTWERVERRDDDGFRRVIHDYEHYRAGQNRGVSIFVPVLARLKMLANYYGVELQAANIASSLGLFITSPFDQQMVEQALLSNDDGRLSTYQDFRDVFHERRRIMFNKARIPILAPGEKVETVSVTRPNSEFSPFTHEMLRSVAALTGQSSEQVHKDYSEASWSSARAGINDAEKMYLRRTEEFSIGVATPMAAGVMHEAMDRGEFDDVLPRRAPEFLDAARAYVNCTWLGTGRGWPDPVAERQGAVLGLDAGFSTLKYECARQGLDYRKVIAQRTREVRMFKAAGLPRAEWMGQDPASKAAEKPQAA